MKKLKIIGLLAMGILIANPITSPIKTEVVFAQNSETQGIISRIEGLPTIEDLQEHHTKEVKGLMEAYAELPMNEKIFVENYPRLKEAYDRMVRDGYITNEMQSEIEEKRNQATRQEKREESGRIAARKTEYTFSVARGEQLTVMLRYTTDADGNGTNDTPDRITITAPSGKTYPVSNASVAMKDEKITNDLTWTDNYLQMDIGEAEEGKWTIQTSIPVTFSQESYQGAAINIEAENKKEEGPAEREIIYDEDGNPIKQEDANTNTQKEEDKDQEEDSNGGSIVLIIIIIIGIIGSLIFMKKGGLTKGKTQKNKKADEMNEEIEMPRQLSDEEVMEQLRREYEEKKKEEELSEQKEDHLEKLNDQKNTKNKYMDDDEINEEEAKAGIQEYREGDTGILDSKDDGSYFDNF